MASYNFSASDQPVYPYISDKRQRLDASYSTTSTFPGLYFPDLPFDNGFWSQADLLPSHSTATAWSQSGWPSQSSAELTSSEPYLNHGFESFQADFVTPVSSQAWTNGFTTFSTQSQDQWIGSQEDQRSPEGLPQVEQYCYGMIPRLMIFSHRSGLSAIASTSLDLYLKSPNTLFLSSEKREFGYLEQRTAEILTALAAHASITFQMYGYVTKRRAMKSTKGPKTGQNDLQYFLNVIIYGPKEFGHGVGEYLGKCKMYLQDPLQCDRDVPYLNPHLLSRNENIVMTSSLRTETAQASSSQDVVTVEAAKDLFSLICDDSHLQDTEPSDLLRTRLYKHQKKALTFMKQREDYWSYEDGPDSLWVKEVDDAGEWVYTNMVTGRSQQTQPEESRGGLLADQMGLGKTLEMISLIASNPMQSGQAPIYTAQGTLRRIKSTLIVVPFSLLDTWHSQLERHLKPKSLSWFRFHGSRTKKVLSISGHDIVLTTYETLMGQLKKYNDPQWPDDTLFSFFWYRIVLDEAHIIRNRMTAIAQACCTIRASRRWAMTGTPIQNRPTDLGSLLEFLHLEPFGDPKILDATVIKPWLRSSDKDTAPLKRLIRYVSLCRTKAIIDLPARKDLIVWVDFTSQESEFYKSAESRTVQKIDAALSVNPVAPGMYLNALEWLNELRLICNHGLVHRKKEARKVASTTSSDGPWNKTTAKKAFATLVGSDSAICKLCNANIAAGNGEADGFEHAKPSLSKCLTVVCGPCLLNRENGEQVPGCECIPSCPKMEVSWAPETSNRPLDACIPSLGRENIPTKLKTVLTDLKRHEKAEKSVVFSFWTYSLDLLESVILEQKSIQYSRIDGSMSGSAREQAIQRFQNDDAVRVILVSITCGGTGLDLTAASRAYLLEPQWNPMLEEQALSRIHRLGQKREVTTIRYRVRDSFEERVAMIQEAKKDIAAGAFSSDSPAGGTNKFNRLQEFRNAF